MGGWIRNRSTLHPRPLSPLLHIHCQTHPIMTPFHHKPS
ncbi:hypothetical protein C370_07329 [Cryptococcus neoformans A1-35-8]|nr:hypothetical protein C370_07329 [Cryptococcus neoformans var. grubii A1-35-8]